MDDIFHHWIDKSGRTLSLSNIANGLSDDAAAWHALTALGYAGIAWDDAGVRVRVALQSIDAGTVDGLTTAHYIADQLEGRVTLTSLAQGVPIGGELDYLDEGTISAALKARKRF